MGPLDVPFHERLMAKHHGAVWREETKTWWAPRGVDLDPLARWVPTRRIYLACPYREKDAASTLGARWDADAGKWYVQPGTNLARSRAGYPEAAPPQARPQRE